MGAVTMIRLARRSDFLAGVAARFLVLFVVFGLIGSINATVGLVQQIGVQRGIEAHLVPVDATVVERHRATKINDETYAVTYPYESQNWRATVRLPNAALVGDQVCLEIDATQPKQARACGTHVDPSDVVFFGILLFVGATGSVIWHRIGRRRKQDPKRAHLEPFLSADEATLATTIREDIGEGKWPIGTALPETAELADYYHTDQATVQIALSALRDEGLMRWRLAADGETFQRTVIAVPETTTANPEPPTD
jgi:hypothetical protein